MIPPSARRLLTTARLKGYLNLATWPVHGLRTSRWRCGRPGLCALCTALLMHAQRLAVVPGNCIEVLQRRSAETSRDERKNISVSLLHCSSRAKRRRLVLPAASAKSPSIVEPDQQTTSTEFNGSRAASEPEQAGSRWAPNSMASCLERMTCASHKNSAAILQHASQVQVSVCRSNAYPFPEIEAKWQRHWIEQKTFRTPRMSEIDTSKPKFYVLDMCGSLPKRQRGVIGTAMKMECPTGIRWPMNIMPL